MARYQRKTSRRVSRYHQNFMADYYAAREAAEQAREDAVGVYGPGSTEWAEYPHHEMINFKQWLINMAGRRNDRPEDEEDHYGEDAYAADDGYAGNDPAAHSGGWSGGDRCGTPRGADEHLNDHQPPPQQRLPRGTVLAAAGIGA